MPGSVQTAAGPGLQNQDPRLLRPGQHHLLLALHPQPSQRPRLSAATRRRILGPETCPGSSFGLRDRRSRISNLAWTAFQRRSAIHRVLPSDSPTDLAPEHIGQDGEGH